MYRRQFHILVLDEDTVALYQTIALLRERDYVVFGAPTIETAGWFLSQWRVDLLVTTATVQGRSGLEVLTAARAQQPALAGVLVGTDADIPLHEQVAQHDAVLLIRPVDPALFLTLVAEKLATIRHHQRWPRKRVGVHMPVWVEGSPATLVDVSYGGLRFALQRESFDLTAPVTVELPAAGLQVTAHLVWSARASDGVSCVCGAAIADDTVSTDWRRFVDWIPNAA